VAEWPGGSIRLLAEMVPSWWLRPQGLLAAREDVFPIACFVAIIAIN